MDRDTFPRQHARTRRFTLGAPRTFRVAAAGTHLTFLRSGSGSDAVNRLWVLDVESATERVLADPHQLAKAEEPADLPEAEQRRRERAREVGGGIVSYSADAGLTTAAFALAGRLYVTGVSTEDGPHRLETEGAAFDPRLDRSGTRIAYVSDGELRLVAPNDPDRSLLADDDPDVTWGAAEFIAAEEMGRSRGFWWSPDGARLAVTRVDNRPVPEWYIADPARPSHPPVAIRYPAAGANNAEVSLHVTDLVGATVEIQWDRDEYPYLAEVSWEAGDPLTVTVQSRDQRRVVILVADPDTGVTTEVHRIVDDVWVELVPGAPTWLNGELVTAEDDGEARRLMVAGRPVTPSSLQVRAIVGVLDGDLVISGSSDPTETHLFVVAEGEARRLTHLAGMHSAAVGGDVIVVSGSDMGRGPARSVVHRRGVEMAEVASYAETPLVDPVVSFEVVGSRELRAAVLYPRSGEARPDSAPLPVLLDPYGGPHAQRVVKSSGAFSTSQWFADQGFAVVVIDGRGTPGRGPSWERAVSGDLAGPVLEDQVDGLAALARSHPRLDLGRVGIRGWSFGGYLAALAVLRRPDVFHAAVAGAPVTDWRLYDTHYTERYLGHPDECPQNYERTDLTAEAGALSRPLMLVHGLADDNVVVAHTLQLSGALLAAGKPHTVLPLSGVTHMTPQEIVAENLLELQVRFLRQALAVETLGA